MENESNKKLISTSTQWSTLCCFDDIINIPINNKIEEKEDNSIEEKKDVFDIESIIENLDTKKKLGKLSSNILLKKELDISISLNKYYFQLSENIKNNILILLKQILLINNILKDRIKMETIKVNYSIITQTYLPRSSYKFCNFKDACNYNYSNNKHKGCYAHHYIHNLLEFDLNISIYYITNFVNDTNINNNKDITKSFTTINFVIKHMYDEINNILLYSKNTDNIEKYHKNNVKNIKQKNKTRKINI